MMAYIKRVASVVLRHTVKQSGLSKQNLCQMNLQTRLTQLLSATRLLLCWSPATLDGKGMYALKLLLECGVDLHVPRSASECC